ncbi:photosystem I reaction center subunit III, chloroplastic-like [Olea europaea subsp. europaea]|uniref:Photosystem I reaction center subunit III n=1 Tax=Olea europaea subsp. europaea TaxID=158383 RepID=A0A8S0P824_OLEEU|nr:photosystem I reaction center subunit III, chloroplastic-like [Olea europaea subsp. europaea]
MSLTIPSNLSKPISLPKLGTKQMGATIICQANSPNQSTSSDSRSEQSLKAFSTAIALSSIRLSAPVLPASADISGLTPCKESKQFAKREKQELKKLESSLKLYAPESAPARPLLQSRPLWRRQSGGSQSILSCFVVDKLK